MDGGLPERAGGAVSEDLADEVFPLEKGEGFGFLAGAEEARRDAEL